MSLKNYISVIILTLFSLVGIGQPKGGEIIFLDKKETYKCIDLSASIDTQWVENSYRRCIAQLHGKGFLEARIDSIMYKNGDVFAYGYQGNPYMLSRIEVDSLTQIVLQEVKIKKKDFVNQTFSPSAYNLMWNETITYLENHGYPFASMDFYAIKLDENRATVKCSITLGPKILLDTLYIKGNPKIKQSVIEGYLRFKKGGVYNQQVLSDYDKRLRLLPYLNVTNPTEIEIIPGKARIYTYLEPNSASHFSGIIGFASGEENRSGLMLTGDVNLRLVNALRRGETNALKWQSLDQGVQRMDISTSWPHLFSPDLALDGSLNFLRRDSTYQNINPKLTLSFRTSFDHWVGVGVNYKKSTTYSFGNYADSGFSSMLYTFGITSGYQNPNYLPVSGFFYKTTLGLGTRKRASSTATSIASTKGELELILENYLPVYSDKLIVFSRLHGAAQHLFDKEEQLLENEVYLIGGHESLRGFNEESIMARNYGIVTMELQYRLERTLNLSLFADMGYASFRQYNRWVDGYPWSIGTGISLITKGGIVDISYALGEGFGQQLQLKNSKVHVGYKASF